MKVTQSEELFNFSTPCKFQRKIKSWVVSSAVERHVDIVKVTGSRPVQPTTPEFIKQNKLDQFRNFLRIININDSLAILQSYSCIN